MSVCLIGTHQVGGHHHELGPPWPTLHTVESQKIDLTLQSNGEALSLMLGNGVLEIEVRDQLVATVDCPDTRRPGLRLHDGLVTVWTGDGRLAVVDSGRREVLANFRTVL